MSSRGCALTLVACLWPLVSACSTEPDPLVDYSSTVELDGFQMSYSVHFPASSGAHAPRRRLLVVAFHGAPGTGEGLRALTGLDTIADQFGITVVYPNAGVPEFWNDGRAETAGTPHIALVAALLDALEARHGPWTDGVHLLGYSQGGLFAEHVACEGSTDVASVNVVAATMMNLTADACRAGPTSFRMTLGTADLTFPPEGRDLGEGLAYLSRDAVLQVWAGLNACTGPRDSAFVQLRHSGRSVPRVSLLECSGNTSVATYPLENVRHQWPTGAVDAGYLTVQEIVDGL